MPFDTAARVAVYVGWTPSVVDGERVEMYGWWGVLVD
jgi:hypothetical protein